MAFRGRDYQDSQSTNATDKSRATQSTTKSRKTKRDSESPPDSQPQSQNGRRMLSMNFSTPVSGAARAEKVKQMTNNHPAFEKTRQMQNVLVDIQTALRRMPGVAANESQEIIDKLQQVGQIVSQEISRLVDSLANITLDDQDKETALAHLSPQSGNKSGNAFASMSLDANLAKAKVNDQARVIDQLKRELASADEKRQQAESELQKITKDLRDMSEEFRRGGSDEMIKALEKTVKQLEDQVNNRRSLWVMARQDPESVAEAVRTLASSLKDNGQVQNALQSLFRGFTKNGPPDDDQPDEIMGPGPTRSLPQRAPSTRPAATFPPPARPGTVGPPPRFGPLTSNTNRTPVIPGSKGAWGQPAPNMRAVSTPNQSYAASPFGRPPAPNANYNNRLQNQNGQQWGGMGNGMNGGQYGVANGNQNYDNSLIVRPPTAMGLRDAFQPQTPTSGPRNRSRFQNLGNQNPQGSDYSQMQITRAGGNAGPLIHINERTVNAWHEKISGFYTVIRTFVERHAGYAFNGNLNQLAGLRLWPILLSTYHPLGAADATSYLTLHLKDSNPKACLVTRVIIDFAVNKVFTPTAWAGADPETTVALELLEQEFDATRGQPSAERQYLLDRQAAIVDAIMKRENILNFYQQRVHDLSDDLFGALQPILNRGVNIEDAVRDMEAVIESAWDLSSSILTSRLTFDFRFPDVGTRFSSQSMLPIWPHLDPMEIQSRHYRVAMVTTPVITCRNDTGTNISAHSVSLADVFCMQ